MTVQLPLIRPHSDWRPPALAELPSWKGAKRISIDVETRDEHLTTLGPGVRRKAYICGISFAIEDGPAYYLPIRHAGGDNLPAENVLTYLREQAKEYRGLICGTNLPYDLDFLAEEGITFWDCGGFRDIQVAEPLINEWQDSYSLATISKKYGFAGKEDALLKEIAAAMGRYVRDVRSLIWELPARYVGPYGIADAQLPLQILRKQEAIIKEQKLEQIYDLECRLLPVLVKMRRRGIKIDFDKLKQIETLVFIKQKEQHEIIHKYTGIKLPIEDLNKKDIVEQICRAAGISVGRTLTGQPRIDRESLSAQIKNPVAAALLEAKKCDKIRNTFIANMHKYATNGRIHCTFHQLRTQRENSNSTCGAAPGRISTCDPCLQNQPARDPEWGKIWRSIFLPDDGGKWLAADYSQQEPRLLIHYAELLRTTGATALADAFRKNPNTDVHSETTRLVYPHLDPKSIEFKEKRSNICKPIFLALCYSMGEARLCKMLGFPTEQKLINGALREVAGKEGKAFLQAFHQKLPFLQEMIKRTQTIAKTRGYIITILGRRCRFPSGLGEERKALNRLIQGSAADQIKLAMVKCDEAGIPLQIQIHDELGLTIFSEKTAEQTAEIMRTCLPLRIPSKVDIEIGNSWGDCMR